jgi:hypothetical protein
MGKIVNYSQKNLRVWRAIFVFSRTFLLNWDTWMHLGMLTCISMVTFSLVFLIPQAGNSTPVELNQGELLGRIQFLLSFVLASYVTMMINRWATLRKMLGSVWGGLEDSVYFANRYLRDETKDAGMRKTIVRLSRLIFSLLFLACQNNADVSKLTQKVEEGGLGIMTKAEEELLIAVPPGNRPMVATGWLFGIIDELIQRGLSGSESATIAQRTQSYFGLFRQVRGGLGATLGFLNTPLPFMYTHLVYWIVQALLLVMAATTGLYLATAWKRRNNANEGFSFDDDENEYPEDKPLWYFNVWLLRVMGNVMFAMFVEGLLKICETIENPFRDDKYGFPSFAYDSFLYNNVMAVYAGMNTYLDVLEHTNDAEGTHGLRGFHRQDSVFSKEYRR